MLNIDINQLQNRICLKYGLDIKALEPMSYGEDSNAKRFKLTDANENAYFIKVFTEMPDNNLKGSDRRERAFLYLKSNFYPDETIDCAYRTLRRII